jgi:hypothetical protein
MSGKLEELTFDVFQQSENMIKEVKHYKDTKTIAAKKQIIIYFIVLCDFIFYYRFLILSFSSLVNKLFNSFCLSK